MSKHELLAAHLRSFEDHRCNLAADALEAQAREIEGLRKQDEALIQQLVEALETCNDSGYYPYSYDEELVEAAAAAARARLAPTPPTA